MLGLDSWDLTVDYHLAPSGDCIVDQAGRASVSWKYKEATVGFYLASLTDVDEARLEYVVVHEFCHVLVDEARLEYVVVHEFCHVLVNQMRGTMNWDHNDMANEERVVTEMARSLIRARHWT